MKATCQAVSIPLQFTMGAKPVQAPEIIHYRFRFIATLGKELLIHSRPFSYFPKPFVSF